MWRCSPPYDICWREDILVWLICFLHFSTWNRRYNQTCESFGLLAKKIRVMIALKHIVYVWKGRGICGEWGGFFAGVLFPGRSESDKHQPWNTFPEVSRLNDSQHQAKRYIPFPETTCTELHLKMDGWKMIGSFWGWLPDRCELWVSGSVSPGADGVGHCLQVDSTELGMEEMEAFWRRNRKAFRSLKFVDVSNET